MSVSPSETALLAIESSNQITIRVRPTFIHSLKPSELHGGDAHLRHSMSRR